jgi:PAS domain S-box-containing protein
LRSKANRVFLVCVALCLAILIFDANNPRGYAEWVLYLLPVSLAFWRLQRRRLAYVASLSVLFLAAGFALSPPGVIPWQLSFINRIAGAIMISFTAFALVRFKTANEVQRESEEKYRVIAENSPNFVGIIQDGLLKYINRTAVDRLGWSYDELVSPSFDPIEKVVSQKFRELIKENVGKRLRGDDSPPYEISLTTRDDSEIPVIVRAAKIIYRGRPAIEFVFNDISERKLIEMELERSNQFLGSVIENAYVWLDVLDSEQNVTVWNKAAEAMSGYSREEVVGHGKVWEWLYPDQEYRKQITDSVTDILQHGRLEQDIETSIKRKDGQTRIISWNERNLVGSDGKVIGSIAIGRDVTEQKQMQEQLKQYSANLEELVEERSGKLAESERRFRELANLLPQIVFETDARGNYTFVNRSGMAAAGYTEEEVYSGLNAVQTFIEGDREKIKKSIENILTGKNTRPHEFTALRRDGTTFPVMIHSTAIVHEGKAVGVRGVAMDMTERKRLEERLVRAEHMAAIGETAAMVGHDLRNPLQGITSAVHLLKEQSLTEHERREMLQLIQHNIEYSDAIVRDLTEYSAEIHLNPVETSPKSIVGEALQAVGIPRKIIVNNRSEDHPTLNVDPDRMKRVFINLIENAIDAMPQAGILTISNAQSDSAVEITISDTGSGIPDKVMQNLWKPLQTTKAKGMGLGLAICKRIVDAHGGEISVKSKVGEGTTVTIRLPLQPAIVEVKQN